MDQINLKAKHNDYTSKSNSDNSQDDRKKYFQCLIVGVEMFCQGHATLNTPHNFSYVS